MNWGSLKNLATSFVHRSDISWDELQPLCLDDINLAFEVQENEALAAVSLIAGTGAAFVQGPLPIDYVAMRAVMISGREYNPVPVKSLISKAVLGNRYAVSGMTLFVTGGAVADIVYTRRLVPLVAPEDANFLSDRYSNVFLYGLLKHAATRIQDQDMRQTYEDQFLAAIQTANSRYQDAAFGPGTTAVIQGGRV